MSTWWRVHYRVRRLGLWKWYGFDLYDYHIDREPGYMESRNFNTLSGASAFMRREWARLNPRFWVNLCGDFWQRRFRQIWDKHETLV